MVINIKGILREFDRPAVMGIVNVTPDSFFSGSRVKVTDISECVGRMLAEGADMIDLGGCSTRPGGASVSADEELDRLLPAVDIIRRDFPYVPLSIDTFRAHVARVCVDHGADIVNDIGGGELDPEMFGTVAALKVPYVLMHMRGTAATMQSLSDYNDVVSDVLRDLAFKVDRLRQLGVADVVADPGFGFAKTVDQNFQLLGALSAFKELGCPLLVGLSRKTMIWKELGVSADEALNGTTALNMAALLNGADILRVHDVKQAAETVRLFAAYARNLPGHRHVISVSDGDGRSLPPHVF